MDRNHQFKLSSLHFGIITTSTCKAPLNKQFLWLCLNFSFGSWEDNFLLEYGNEFISPGIFYAKGLFESFSLFRSNQCFKVMRGGEGKT